MRQWNQIAMATKNRREKEKVLILKMASIWKQKTIVANKRAQEFRNLKQMNNILRKWKQSWIRQKTIKAFEQKDDNHLRGKVRDKIEQVRSNKDASKKFLS